MRKVSPLQSCNDLKVLVVSVIDYDVIVPPCDVITLLITYKKCFSFSCHENYSKRIKYAYSNN